MILFFAIWFINTLILNKVGVTAGSLIFCGTLSVGIVYFHNKMTNGENGLD